MRTRRTVAALVSALALGASGLVAASGPATAAPTVTADPCTYVFLSNGGSEGLAITCEGHPFRAFVSCQRGDIETYRNFGALVPSGGTSTAWCELGDMLIGGGGAQT
ncbi:hypothetical protein ACIBCM_07985 [Streptomyces sp. NPDC051018]|uniref:hypothetical protein n=1 Tax=Streptomyces sp. NPDC051018 TaxID=3365639 RepID=UPI00379A9CCE